MNNQRFATTLIAIIALTGILASGQQFPPLGDDTTSSLGSFKVQIMPNFVGLFYNPTFPPAAQCPLFDPTTNILSSPSQLYDPGTLIGRSMTVADGSNSNPPWPSGPPSDIGGAPVGSAGTDVNESMLIPPPGFPCSGVANCSSGPNTADVLTEVRSLHMTGSGAAVRAGVWYNSPNSTSAPPAGKISRGKVESQSGPNGLPSQNFPASSFFDVFVQVDIPACGAFPGAFTPSTLYNLMPLVVKNNQVTSFPPKVVYLHDSTSIVPILFLYPDTQKPPRWQKDDILGYFLLVGHGVGFSNSQSDLNQFNSTMGGQSNASCPIGPPPPGGTSKTVSTGTSSSMAPKPANGAGSKSRPGGADR